MKIGKNELWILKYLSYDNSPNGYDDIREKMGRDPSKLLKQFVGEYPKSAQHEKRVKEYLHRYQVVFSQTIHRLIEKGLIKRTWGITTRFEGKGSDIDVSWVGKGYSEKDPQGVLWYFYRSDDKDISGFNITSVYPVFSLTKKGVIELRKRWPVEHLKKEYQGF